MENGATGVFVKNNWSICQYQLEYLSVATGHPVKRCLLQSNDLPKSIPELSLQNQGKFLVPSDGKLQKGHTCYQNPNLTILKTLLTIS